MPSVKPTTSPSKNPTRSPSLLPTSAPSDIPTSAPTINPSSNPTQSPTTSNPTMTVAIKSTQSTADVQEGLHAAIDPATTLVEFEGTAKNDDAFLIFDDIISPIIDIIPMAMLSGSLI